ncbi:MAG: hypothetical protein ACRCW0_04970 [Clostridium sp.]|uniref:hypothetical protein n=1 Tax=Paraclostridium bifermentans TaxID=1490 RepID=UPI00242B7618|nr:hypothetical protein [Paraclostridium bifermentans]MDO7204251.1 hypothetical protein [Paraclostridium bifermentans]
MRGFILTIGVMFVGFYLTIAQMFISMERYKTDTMVLNIVESAKIASIVNLDDSARVEEDYVDITEVTFEEGFEKLFYKNLNANIKIKDISYKYLRDKDNKIKAVKVKVKDSNDTEYQAVLKENTTYTKN